MFQGFKSKDKKEGELEEHVKKLTTHEQLAYQYGLNVGKNKANKEHADADRGSMKLHISHLHVTLRCAGWQSNN